MKFNKEKWIEWDEFQRIWILESRFFEPYFCLVDITKIPLKNIHYFCMKYNIELVISSLGNTYFKIGDRI